MKWYVQLLRNLGLTFCLLSSGTKLQMGLCLSKNEPETQKPHVTVSHHQAAHTPDTVLGMPFQDFNSHYTLDKELGRGGSALTYLCTENSTGELYACKSILKSTLVGEVEKDDARREVQIMQHLTGKTRIVQLKGAYEDAQFVYIVMELCTGGDLFDRIVAKGHYTERAAAAICKTIVKIVQTCHSMGVIHRDIRPENFLYSTDGKGALLKVIDFGLSAFTEEVA